MIIRQAQMADLDAIYAIELENFSPEEAVSRESLAAHIQTLSSTFLVAEKDDKILGYLEGPVRPSGFSEAGSRNLVACSSQGDSCSAKSKGH